MAKQPMVVTWDLNYDLDPKKDKLFEMLNRLGLYRTIEDGDVMPETTVQGDVDLTTHRLGQNSTEVAAELKERMNKVEGVEVTRICVAFHSDATLWSKDNDTKLAAEERRPRPKLTFGGIVPKR